MIVLDEDTDMVSAALRIMRFYQHESCGWCIPCREGTTWLKKLLTRFRTMAKACQGRHRDDRRSGQRTCSAAPSVRLATPPPCPPSASSRSSVTSSRLYLVNGPKPCARKGLAGTIGSRVKWLDLSQTHRRRPGNSSRARHAGHQRGQTRPALKFPPSAITRAIRSRLPAACAWWKWRKGPEDDGRLHAPRWPKAWSSARKPRRLPKSPQVHSRISAYQSPARLSGLRQGRRVRTAGHGVPLRRGRKPLHRNQNPPR